VPRGAWYYYVYAEDGSILVKKNNLRYEGDA